MTDKRYIQANIKYLSLSLSLSISRRESGDILRRPTHRWWQLAVDARRAERRVGGKTLVPLAGSRLRDGLHETPLQLTDARVVTHDLRLGLIHVLQGGRAIQNGGGGKK